MFCHLTLAKVMVSPGFRAIWRGPLLVNSSLITTLLVLASLALQVPALRHRQRRSGLGEIVALHRTEETQRGLTVIACWQHLLQWLSIDGHWHGWRKGIGTAL